MGKTGTISLVETKDSPDAVSSDYTVYGIKYPNAGGIIKTIKNTLPMIISNGSMRFYFTGRPDFSGLTFTTRTFNNNITGDYCKLAYYSNCRYSSPNASYETRSRDFELFLFNDGQYKLYMRQPNTPILHSLLQQ